MSFSIDLTDLFTYASTMFNALGPVLVLVGGLSMGAAVAFFVLKLLRGLFHSGA